MYLPELIRKEGLRRGLSPRTIITYRQCIKQFFRYYSKDPKEIRKNDIKGYLNLLIERGASGNTLNVNLNALKFLYNEVLNKRLLLRVRFSKTPKTMPIALTKEEISRLLESIENPKHKLIVSLMYSAGLRLGEVIKLRSRDFMSNHGWVRNGKGNKDRPFIIAEKLKESLSRYINNCQTENSYLFLGKRGRYISPETVRQCVKKAAKKAGINKNVHPHTLRHSFSTHLIEEGCDITSVQSLLGHSSAETTMVYVHMASPRIISVKSPFDSLR